MFGVKYDLDRKGMKKNSKNCMHWNLAQSKACKNFGLLAAFLDFCVISGRVSEAITMQLIDRRG